MHFVTRLSLSVWSASLAPSSSFLSITGSDGRGLRLIKCCLYVTTTEPVRLSRPIVPQNVGGVQRGGAAGALLTRLDP